MHLRLWTLHCCRTLQSCIELIGQSREPTCRMRQSVPFSSVHQWTVDWTQKHPWNCCQLLRTLVTDEPCSSNDTWLIAALVHTRPLTEGHARGTQVFYVCVCVCMCGRGSYMSMTIWAYMDMWHNDSKYTWRRPKETQNGSVRHCRSLQSMWPFDWLCNHFRIGVGDITKNIYLCYIWALQNKIKRNVFTHLAMSGCTS